MGQTLWRKPEPSHALCILIQGTLITLITVLEGVQGFQPQDLRQGNIDYHKHFWRRCTHRPPLSYPVKWVSTKIRPVPSWCVFALFSQFCSPWANKLGRSGVYLISITYKRRVENYSGTAHCAHGERSSVQTATKPIPCLNPSLALNGALNLDTAQG